MRRYVRLIACVLLSCCAMVGGQQGPAAEIIPFEAFAHVRVEAVLDEVQSTGDWDAAKVAAQQLFDQAVLYTPADRPAALREADFALRLVAQLRTLRGDHRTAMLRFLRANPDVARDILFLMPLHDDGGAALAVLDRLREARPTLVEPYASLAAAISVVHRRPLERRLNENTAAAIDPLDIFDFYVANEKRMLFGIRAMPPELLAYVVDVTGSIDELKWALANYQGSRNVGQRFFDVVYDYNSFRYGTEKQLTLHGFSLPNMLRFGGVCVDQAYFAAEVGKAIGVPTAIAFGESANSAHAWVGYLESDGASVRWNFEAGRYEDYVDVRGNVIDPITRRHIADSSVSLTAEIERTSAVGRWNAAALSDAANRLMAMKADRRPTPPDRETIAADSLLPLPRNADVTAELGLLDAALHQSAACSAAWAAVRDLAVGSKLSPQERDHWLNVLLNFGGARYPDFTYSIVAPIVAGVADPTRQNQLWQRLFTVFSTRLNLAASIRMHQAELLMANGQANAALNCYLEIIHRYSNSGPFMIAALQSADRIMTDSGNSAMALQLYARTWQGIEPPDEMAHQFMAESNWYRVGMLYAAKLRAAGVAAQAAMVEARLRTD